MSIPRMYQRARRRVAGHDAYWWMDVIAMLLVFRRG
jgi:hypothetical protein